MTKARLLEENELIKQEKKELLATLEKEQGNLSVYHEKQAAATAAIGDLEKKLQESQEKLAQREADRQQATQDKKVLEQEVVAVKKDIDDIMVAIQKLEQEKTNRDHTIKSLNDEIANQDEVINKLNKEKKHISENAAKSMEDLQVAEDKVGHLNQIKSKLESTLDELEGSYEKEKRARANIEKERRKIEGELRIMQETVSELERSRKELENAIQRKEKDSGATSAQIELNKKREAEVSKLRRDLEEAKIQQEATIVALKKKHADATAEMQEQVEQLNKIKAKIEKDKTVIMHEIADARAATDEVNRSKSSSEKNVKNLQGTLNDLGKKMEEANLTLGDMEAYKRKLAAENP